MPACASSNQPLYVTLHERSGEKKARLREQGRQASSHEKGKEKKNKDTSSRRDRGVPGPRRSPNRTERNRAQDQEA
ncbi:hypothetical protein BC567DRAFT_236254 [Phyllosticta citribraziliensis]